MIAGAGPVPVTPASRMRGKRAPSAESGAMKEAEKGDGGDRLHDAEAREDDPSRRSAAQRQNGQRRAEDQREGDRSADKSEMAPELRGEFGAMDGVFAR